MLTTKDRVLLRLFQADGFVSGEEISNRLGISRASVNAAVKTLKSEGYNIESVTNKGYKINGSAGKLTAGEIAFFLGEERSERMTFLKSVDSTNNYLKKLCSDGGAQKGECVVADRQTGGKGRMGRRFFSAENAGIYLSYSIDTKDASPAEISEITAWGAVTVCRAVEEAVGISCGIKWVNDIIIDNKKIAGILTELSVEGESGRIQSVIMGIGVNVNNSETDFPDEISNIASSLKIVSGRELNRAKLCAVIIKKLDEMCADFPRKREDYYRDYKNYCRILGKKVTVVKPNGSRDAVVLDIDPNFGLEVDYGNETEVLRGGEISIKKIYGGE